MATSSITELLDREGWLTISKAAERTQQEGIRLGKARISQLVNSRVIPSELIGNSRMVRWQDVRDYADAQKNSEEKALRRHAAYFGLSLDEARALRAKAVSKQAKKN